MSIKLQLCGFELAFIWFQLGILWFLSQNKKLLRLWFFSNLKLSLNFQTFCDFFHFILVFLLRFIRVNPQILLCLLPQIKTASSSDQGKVKKQKLVFRKRARQLFVNGFSLSLRITFYVLYKNMICKTWFVAASCKFPNTNQEVSLANKPVNGRKT